jgi:hypothetical protein
MYYEDEVGNLCIAAGPVKTQTSSQTSTEHYNFEDEPRQIFSSDSDDSPVIRRYHYNDHPSETKTEHYSVGDEPRQDEEGNLYIAAGPVKTSTQTSTERYSFEDKPKHIFASDSETSPKSVIRTYHYNDHPGTSQTSTEHYSFEDEPRHIFASDSDDAPNSVIRTYHYDDQPGHFYTEPLQRTSAAQNYSFDDRPGISGGIFQAGAHVYNSYKVFNSVRWFVCSFQSSGGSKMFSFVCSFWFLVEES